MLQEFKNFDANRMGIDELVALSAYGGMLRKEYDSHNLEEPEFVDVQLKTLRREIRSRNADRLETMLKERKARFDALKTPTERKAELKKEMAKLEEQLAEVG